MIRVNLNFNFRWLSALFCIFLFGCLASEEQRRLEVTREYYEHLVYNTSSGSFLRDSNKNTLEHLQEIDVQDLERPFLLEVRSAGWNPLAEKKVVIDILWSKGWYVENHLEFNIVDWDKSFVSEIGISWPEVIEMGTIGGPVEDLVVYQEYHAIPKEKHDLFKKLRDEVGPSSVIRIRLVTENSASEWKEVTAGEFYAPDWKVPDEEQEKPENNKEKQAVEGG